MKEALYWKKLKEKVVKCELCPRFCVIKPGSRGNCGVRENQNGKLFSVVYGKPVSAEVDPIEKKPFFHFLPGEPAFSISTVGCNLHCMYCQNWRISQCSPEEVSSLDMLPKKVIDEAKRAKCRIISYTYTEPTVFYEYMYDTAKLAKKEKIRNTIVSNGFINQKPLIELCKYIEAANIDLKGNDAFYKKITGAWLKPIQDALITLKKKGVWIELTNLIIPGYNDSEKDIKWLINWIKNNLGADVPLHFSAFYPMYKLINLPSTTAKTVNKARKMAMNAGLHYVYSGNIDDEEGLATYCPKCGKAVIKRSGFYVTENHIKNGKCPCGEKIAGVWK